MRFNLYKALIPRSIRFELAHGKSANFMTSFDIMPEWTKEFAAGFVKDLSDKNLKTLKVQVHTSVGKIIEVHPRDDLIRALKQFRKL